MSNSVGVACAQVMYTIRVGKQVRLLVLEQWIQKIFEKFRVGPLCTY